MNDARIAGLRRKYAATQEPAKRNELANLLRAEGVDPDAVEAVSVAPKGRTAEVKVTAAPSKPRATTKAAPKPAARRPARPAKVTGSGGITLPSPTVKKTE